MIKLTTSMVMPSSIEYYLNSRSILDQSFDKSFASKAKATFTIEVKQVAGNSESIQFVIKFELLLSTGSAENPRYAATRTAVPYNLRRHVSTEGCAPGSKRSGREALRTRGAQGA